MSLFEMKRVSLSYGGPFALQEVDLQIQPGEFLGILGPNGAGKSSLLRILAGLISPSAGEASLESNSLIQLNPRERAQKIAFVPQWTVMAFPFTVFEVVLMGRHPHLGRMALESHHDLEIATQALQKTDSIQFKDRNFSELSGGEMQRVIVARAIAQQTSILLLDEPTSALDIQQQQRIYGILKKLNEEGKTIIVTTHDLNLAAQYCQRILLLNHGKVAADGKPSTILTEKKIEEIYGAPVEILQRGQKLFIMPKLENAS